MKRYGLLLATLTSVVFGAWSLCAVGGSPRQVPASVSSEAATLSAAWNYHRCHARHWRHCLLQH